MGTNKLNDSLYTSGSSEQIFRILAGNIWNTVWGKYTDVVLFLIIYLFIKCIYDVTSAICIPTSYMSYPIFYIERASSKSVEVGGSIVNTSLYSFL